MWTGLAGLAAVGLVGAAVLSREPIPISPEAAPAQPIPTRAEDVRPVLPSEPVAEPLVQPIAAPAQPVVAPPRAVASTPAAPRPTAVAVTRRQDPAETPTVARETPTPAKGDWERQREEYERARFAYQAREKQEGFRWARQNRVNVARYCDQRTAAFAEGCRDYVRIADQEG